jgi:hypothetical protein
MSGMNFHVWGPVSCRPHDVWMLTHSNLRALLEALQFDMLLKYAIYGDSAFRNMVNAYLKAAHYGGILTHRQGIQNSYSPLFISCDYNIVVLENKTMKRCRETVEWDYGDEDAMFKILCFKNGLQIQKMNIPCLTLSCMLLRNALICLNRGCKTAAYYNCRPPTFQDWIANGPRDLNPEWFNEILNNNAD